MSVPGDPVIKNLPANVADAGSIPDSGRSLEKEWQPIEVFLPGVFYEERSLVGYSP